MKNLTHVKVLFLLLFLPFVNQVFADPGDRPRVVKTNWVNPMYPFGDIPVDDPNLVCLEITAPSYNLSFNVKVTTASLDLSSVDPIYVSYDFDGNAGIYGPIDPSSYDSSYIYKETRLYEWWIPFSFNVQSNCSAAQPPSYKISYSIVTLDQIGAGYAIYPTQNHPVLFPSFIFGTDIPSYQIEKNLCCPHLLLSSGNNTGNGISQNIQRDTDTSNKNKSTSIQDIQVSPNPFHESFNLNYEFKKPIEVTITLLNANGTRIQTTTQNLVGDGTFSLNLEEKKLPVGLYFVYIETETEHKIIKMIKGSR